MLMHIVLFRRRPELVPDPVREHRLIDRLRVLDRSIGMIRAWRVSANVLERPICWDWVLEARFDDADTLDAYLSHPSHVELLADLMSYLECAVCDYFA